MSWSWDGTSEKLLGQVTRPIALANEPVLDYRSKRGSIARLSRLHSLRTTYSSKHQEWGWNDIYSKARNPHLCKERGVLAHGKCLQWWRAVWEMWEYHQRKEIMFIKTCAEFSSFLMWKVITVSVPVQEKICLSHAAVCQAALMLLLIIY